MLKFHREVLENTRISKLEGDIQMNHNRISVEQVKQDLEAGRDFVLLDVRTKEEFHEGHIEGAINIPLQTLAYDIENEVPEKDQIIVLYCRSGIRTLTAAEILKDLEYTKVYDMGGIISWPYEVVVE